MNADSIKIECDEDGFHIVIEGALNPDHRTDTYSWRITDPEALYDHVKTAIGPWLYEREKAFSEFREAAKSGTGPAAAFFCREEDVDESGGMAENSYDRSEAYDQDDPKHKDWHSTHADIWDNRDKTLEAVEGMDLLKRKLNEK